METFDHNYPVHIADAQRMVAHACEHGGNYFAGTLGKIIITSKWWDGNIKTSNNIGL